MNYFSFLIASQILLFTCTIFGHGFHPDTIVTLCNGHMKMPQLMCQRNKCIPSHNFRTKLDFNKKIKTFFHGTTNCYLRINFDNNPPSPSESFHYRSIESYGGQAPQKRINII